jgi:hypothetical protein
VPTTNANANDNDHPTLRRRRAGGVQSANEFLKRDDEMAQLDSSYQANEAANEGQFRKGGRGTFVISVQSESRLGVSDFGMFFHFHFNSFLFFRIKL